ncbi:MAG: aldo/keto reductase [Coriobacteriales bacterium]|nr:aldo/keto reductase [Coriobacteriales bacterium]
MPQFGLGTYKDSTAEAVRAVSYALSIGYRMVDTASLYQNEEGVGRAVAESGLRREDVFITSKVWNAEQGYGGTLAALDRSLRRLGTDYLDLYLVHWPIKRHLEGTWRAMEEAHSAGRIRAIGVSNFLEPHLEALLEIAEVRPVVDQIEFHPRLQQPRVQELLADLGIVLQAWAPIMRGRVNLIPQLVQIAQTHDKTPAQVAIRWVLQLGYSVIPKSTHEARIHENADVFDFELSEAEMAAIASLDDGTRIGPDPYTNVWRS